MSDSDTAEDRVWEVSHDDPAPRRSGRMGQVKFADWETALAHALIVSDEVPQFDSISEDDFKQRGEHVWEAEAGEGRFIRIVHAAIHDQLPRGRSRGQARALAQEIRSRTDLSLDQIRHALPDNPETGEPYTKSTLEKWTNEAAAEVDDA